MTSKGLQLALDDLVDTRSTRLQEVLSVLIAHLNKQDTDVAQIQSSSSAVMEKMSEQMALIKQMGKDGIAVTSRLDELTEHLEMQKARFSEYGERIDLLVADHTAVFARLDGIGEKVQKLSTDGEVIAVQLKTDIATQFNEHSRLIQQVQAGLHSQEERSAAYKPDLRPATRKNSKDAGTTARPGSALGAGAGSCIGAGTATGGTSADAGTRAGHGRAGVSAAAGAGRGGTGESCGANGDRAGTSVVPSTAGGCAGTNGVHADEIGMGFAVGAAECYTGKCTAGIPLGGTGDRGLDGGMVCSMAAGSLGADVQALMAQCQQLGQQQDALAHDLGTQVHELRLLMDAMATGQGRSPGVAAGEPSTESCLSTGQQPGLPGGEGGHLWGSNAGVASASSINGPSNAGSYGPPIAQPGLPGGEGGHLRGFNPGVASASSINSPSNAGGYGPPIATAAVGFNGAGDQVGSGGAGTHGRSGDAGASGGFGGARAQGGLGTSGAHGGVTGRGSASAGSAHVGISASMGFVDQVPVGGLGAVMGPGAGDGVAADGHDVEVLRGSQGQPSSRVGNKGPVGVGLSSCANSKDTREAGIAQLKQEVSLLSCRLEKIAESQASVDGGHRERDEQLASLSTALGDARREQGQLADRLAASLEELHAALQGQKAAADSLATGQQEAVQAQLEATRQALTAELDKLLTARLKSMQERETVNATRADTEIQQLRAQLELFLSIDASATARCLSCFDRRAQVMNANLVGVDGKTYIQPSKVKEMKDIPAAPISGDMRLPKVPDIRGAHKPGSKAVLMGGAGAPLHTLRTQSTFLRTEEGPLRSLGRPASTPSVAPIAVHAGPPST